MRWREAIRTACGIGVLLPFAAARAGELLGQASEPESGTLWFRFIASLLLCLMLAVGGALALRARMGHAAPALQVPAWGRRLLAWVTPRLRISEVSSNPPRLRLVQSLRLSPQVQVCLLDLDGDDVLVSVTAAGSVAVLKVTSAEARS